MSNFGSFLSRSTQSSTRSIHSAWSDITATGALSTQHWSPLRCWIRSVVQSGVFSSIILCVVLVNTALIAVQTDPASHRTLGWYVEFVDNVFLGIYVFEMVLKLYVYRRAFFRSGWNNFDLVIVATSFIDWLQFIIASAVAVNPKIFRLLRIFRAVRALRALRVLRTVQFLKSLQVIVATILSSLPAMSTIFLFVLFVLYVFAIVGRNLYGDLLPQYFGNMQLSIFSLFRLITLDNWYVFHEESKKRDVTIVLFLVVFIVLETFVFINLFIAVIVSNLEAAQSQAARRRNWEEARRRVEEDKALEAARSSAIGQETDEGTQPGTARHYYPDKGIPHRQKELMAHYFMLMASLESNTEHYNQQKKVLNDLVDLAIETERDG